jgi:D-serine deaminase-like pyridoxal phosphate-dependent protein
MAWNWEVEDTSEIITPALLIYKDRVASNLGRMLEMAGSAARLRPHVKTHKMREIVAMALARGITKHKCATIAEAEMLADCGVPDVFLAYPLVGPNPLRMAKLIEKYPKATFLCLVDHPAATRRLSEVMKAEGAEVGVLVDLDLGQHRTGIAPGESAGDLYRLVDDLPALEPAGLHVYDGHNHQESLADRVAAAREQMKPVWALRQRLLDEGLSVPRMVLGGTPTFPVYSAIDGSNIECAPGTCVLHDDGYGSRFPDLPFVHAAVLLSRVISIPTADRVCLDLGYKGVASDPKGDRVKLLNLEGRQVLQNEEHLVVETPEAGTMQPGDEVYAIPTHICPTSALHKQAWVIEDGRLVDRWLVAARDRWLTV